MSIFIERDKATLQRMREEVDKRVAEQAQREKQRQIEIEQEMRKKKKEDEEYQRELRRRNP